VLYHRKKEEEEMEITFTSGFLQKTEDLVEKKLQEINSKDETVWQSTIRKQKEKKKKRKKILKQGKKEGDEGGEEEMLVETEVNNNINTSNSKKKNKKESIEEKKAKAELELLMIPEDNEEQIKGYNLPSLLKEEKKEEKTKVKEKYK